MEDSQNKAAKILLEQAESFLTKTDFFKHGKLSSIKQISSALEPILKQYPQLTSEDHEQIITLFEADLKRQIIKR